VPARAKAQRAATAGEEDVTATANCPVRAQRAARENVMGRLLEQAKRTLAAAAAFVKYNLLTRCF
jgi:hypothetical protein